MMKRIAYFTSHREQLVSGLGGALGIAVVWWVSLFFLDGHAALLVATSMGSSAVLLFATPQGPMSQPWPLIGGHFVSALIGISCARWFGNDPVLASSLAVGISISLMYFMRCLHPPGGATALAAVLGGPSVHALGYGFAFSPVLLNTLTIFIAAVGFNYLFPWRRYPQKLYKRREMEEKAMIPHSRLVYALSQIDTFIDITEEDLQRIYLLAINEESPANKSD